MKKIAMGLAAMALTGSAVQAQAPTRTVWDGAFTADQAAAGKTQYETSCAMCHGIDLGGAESAPALAGTTFLGNWSGQAVGDLSTRIHATMPANNPGSLSNKQVADIVAYMLSVNQFPTGSLALPNDPALQSQVTIVSEKPAGK